MGGEWFSTKASGPNVDAAFTAAVADARYEYGHRGYTGTIAEKDSFNMIPLPEGVDPEKYAYDTYVMDQEVCEKWGPAACFDLGNDEYLFFGWASS